MIRNTAKNRDDVASYIENSGATVDIEDVKAEYPDMSESLEHWADCFIAEHNLMSYCCLNGNMDKAKRCSDRKDMMIKTGKF